MKSQIFVLSVQLLSLDSFTDINYMGVNLYVNYYM